jgi:hypothetical protein
VTTPFRKAEKADKIGLFCLERMKKNVIIST